MNKKYNLPAVNNIYTTLPWRGNKFVGNFRKTFWKLFCPVTNLSQQNLYYCYVFKKYNFTAVNKCFISIKIVNIPVKFSLKITSLFV